MRDPYRPYVIIAAVLAMLLPGAAAGQAQLREFPRTDPASIIRPPEGYVLWSHTLTREGSYGFSTSSGTVTKEGLVRRIEFRPVEGAGGLPPGEILESQADPLEAAGAVLVGRSEGRVTYRLKSGGYETWVEIVTTSRGYVCTIVEETPAPGADIHLPEGPTLRPSIPIEPALPGNLLR